MAKGLLNDTPMSGVTDVFGEIKCALQILQVQQRQIMNQEIKESEQSLCLLDQILDLHIQHMEELLKKGNTLTGQSSQEC